MDKEDVNRNIVNFCRVPLWNTTMNVKEVEYLFNSTGGWIFCNGHIRDVITDKITDNCFKVYTQRKIYA